MILIDFSGVLYSCVLGQIYRNKEFEYDEMLIRHAVLSSLRSYKKKFSEYGKPVITCDGKNYWRNVAFPYYKAKRKEQREASIEVNWKQVFNFMERLKTEVKTNLPWPVLDVEGAEADDIIAHLSFNNLEPIMIVSRDHDLIQLQRQSNIKQFNAIDDRFEQSEDVNRFLFEHICRGDKGDGIPNILSPDNSIVVGLRQKPLTQKKLDVWYQEKKIPDEYRARFATNMKLIDLRMIPDVVKDDINKALISQINKKVKMNETMKYFMDHDLHDLSNLIRDFF